MRFELSDDQQEIKRTARELLAARAPWEQVRAAAEAGRYDEGLWRELCELGWPGIAIAERDGGQGLGVVELCVLVEELGYACAATPLLGSALAGLGLSHAGTEEQRRRWLPGLASGELRGAFGSARDGVAELVPDAAGADVVVLIDDDLGGGEVLVGGVAEPVAAIDAERRDGRVPAGGGEPLAGEVVGGGVQPVAAIDPTRRYGRVTAGGGEPLGGDVGGAFERACVTVGAELVGVCRRALDMTVAYVKDRRQFGVPVGSFQAVQHRAAQMLLDTEAAAAAGYYAAWAADADPSALPMAAAMAKATASDAGRDVTGAAIQLHGGIGFTWEANVHWLFKRAQLDSAFLGGAAFHRARVAELVRERAATHVSS